MTLRSNQSDDTRSHIQRRGPVFRGTIEKAHDPRGALVRLAIYLKPFAPS